MSRTIKTFERAHNGNERKKEKKTMEKDGNSFHYSQFRLLRCGVRRIASCSKLNVYVKTKHKKDPVNQSINTLIMTTQRGKIYIYISQ